MKKYNQKPEVKEKLRKSKKNWATKFRKEHPEKVKEYRKNWRKKHGTKKL